MQTLRPRNELVKKKEKENEFLYFVWKKKKKKKKTIVEIVYNLHKYI